MLSRLRAQATGGPSARTRVIAALVAVGLVLLTAPLLLIPLIRLLLHG